MGLMDISWKMVPKKKANLTPPEDLVERLECLIGSQFVLTLKARTDGSNFRKLIAKTLENYKLPDAVPRDECDIPSKKGLPGLTREYIDTYLATSGDSYNLQVWNRNPVDDQIQIRTSDEDIMRANEVRFVLGKITNNRISSIAILTPNYIETRWGKFGKPTIKQQLIIPSFKRAEILLAQPPILFEGESDIGSVSSPQIFPPNISIHSPIDKSKLYSLDYIREVAISKLLGKKIDAGATKTRGQAFEGMVGQALGYVIKPLDRLAGGYPDIFNQALEVKVQDSPTVDLGKFSPQFDETISEACEFTTKQIRYLIALTNRNTGMIEGIIVCNGESLSKHFSYVAEKSWKSQRSIPMDFFKNISNKVIFNPEIAK